MGFRGMTDFKSRQQAELNGLTRQRIGAGDGEKHRDQRDEADDAVMEHERDSMEWIERKQHFGMLHDRGNRSDRDDAEPDTHHWPEEGGNTRGAARLSREQRHQDEHRQWHDIGIERRGNELDTFDRGKHRQRRRDHRVAVNDTDAADQESREAGGGMSLAMPIGRRGFRGGSYNIAGHGNGGLKMLHSTISKATRLIGSRLEHSLARFWARTMQKCIKRDR